MTKKEEKQKAKKTKKSNPEKATASLDTSSVGWSKAAAELLQRMLKYMATQYVERAKKKLSDGNQDKNQIVKTEDILSELGALSYNKGIQHAMIAAKFSELMNETNSTSKKLETKKIKKKTKKNKKGLKTNEQ